MYSAFHIDDKDFLHNLIWAELRKFGIKESLCERVRKTTKPSNGSVKNLFGKPLSALPSEEASLLIQGQLEEPDAPGRLGTVSGDIIVEIPLFVSHCCQFILGNCEVEGIFRKAGSSSRQKEIRKLYELGEQISNEHHVIDMASILKQFLRELPEPLIPFSLHKVFTKCLELENEAQCLSALNLACLLLPTVSLATLCYLLQFLEAVAGKSSENLMDISNLAIVMTPSLMPLPPDTRNKMADASSCTRLQNHARVIELLIRNNTSLCILPLSVSSHFGTSAFSSSDELEDHGQGRSQSRDPKRRRRTGSITRVFDGLKKMVGRKSGPPSAASSIEHLNSAPANSTAPPTAGRLNLKRIAETDNNLQVSIKKKKTGDVTGVGKVLATTPYTPGGQHQANTREALLAYNFHTPSIDLRPSPTNSPQSPELKQGVLRFFQKKRGPSQKPEDPSKPTYVKTPKVPKRRLSLGRKSIRKALQRREESDDHSNRSESEIKIRIEKSEQKPEEPEPTAEAAPVAPETGHSEAVYEEMKQHYEAVKISVENEQMALDAVSTPPGAMAGPAGDPVTPVSDLIQVAYEKTLEHSERFSSVESDKLAKQLSRELRIRRSAENRVIRSPSARKIGAIRRRSRESPRSSLSLAGSPRRLTRSQSAVTSRTIMAQLQQLQQQIPEPCIRSGLRRGRPNSVRSGLRNPSPMRTPSQRNAGAESAASETPTTSKRKRAVSDSAELVSQNSASRSSEKKRMPRGNSVQLLAKNFESSSAKLPSQAPAVESSPNQCQWQEASVVLKQFPHLKSPLGGRPSLQKIRQENSGRVSAYAKKFDGLVPVAKVIPLPKSPLAGPQRPSPSPLKESQRMNEKTTPQTPALKAPLLTPGPCIGTPCVIKMRPQTRRRPSPLKATGSVRRSPRLHPVS